MKVSWPYSKKEFDMIYGILFKRMYLNTIMPKFPLFSRLQILSAIIEDCQDIWRGFDGLY